MSKLFDECEWADDLPAIGSNFRFSKTSKLKKAKRRTEADGVSTKNGQPKEDNTSTGWSVLLANRKGNTAQLKPNSKASNGATQFDATNGKGNKRKAQKRKANDKLTVTNTEANVESSAKLAKKKAKLDEALPRNATTGTPDNVTLNQNVQPVGKLQEKTSSKLGKTVKRSGNFRDKLIESLKGSRFRFINEQLYKMSGEEAKKLFQEDPTTFNAYHEGYRQQVEQWPMNPLNRMINSILKLPKDTIVADFGCGEAKLAASVPNKVYSLDLVANHNGVIACDMANTPLESNFVNVAVFCLSLMGTNLVDFLLEANRVLKVGGVLKIAEVSSRFENVNDFINTVKKCGFKLDVKDLKHSLFYFFNFKKDRTVIKGSMKIKPYSLKPCLYKKR
uniref:Ribosomal RNA-processing protein 8 n=1 Tax=Anopheles dirus TaxID=7168 RepID=A0A182N3D2_9DIPT